MECRRGDIGCVWGDIGCVRGGDIARGYRGWAYYNVVELAVADVGDFIFWVSSLF